MKIKVPKKIKITTHTYRLKYKPHIFIDDRQYGCGNHRSMEIDIEPTLSQSSRDNQG